MNESKIMNRLDVGGQIKHVAQEDLERNIDAFAEQFGNDKVYVANSEGAVGPVLLSELKNALASGHTLYDDTQGYLSREDVKQAAQGQQEPQQKEKVERPTVFDGGWKGSIPQVGHSLLKPDIQKAMESTLLAVEKTPMIPGQTQLEYNEKVTAIADKIQKENQQKQEELARQMALPQTTEEINLKLNEINNELRQYEEDKPTYSVNGEMVPNMRTLFNPNRRQLTPEQTARKGELERQKTALELQYRFLDKIQEYEKYDRGGDYSKLGKMFRGLAVNGDLQSFAAMGLDRLHSDMEFRTILDKAQRMTEEREAKRKAGNLTPVENILTPDEQKAMILYQNMKDIAAMDRGIWFSVGSGLYTTFEFMRDMALAGIGGGFGSVAKMSFTQALKQTSKNLLKKGIEVAWKTPLLPGFYSNLSKNVTDNYSIKNYGTDLKPRWYVGQNDSLGRVLYETWAQQSTEYFTEALGGALGNLGLIRRIAQGASKSFEIVRKGAELYDKIYNKTLSNSIGKAFVRSAQAAGKGLEKFGLNNAPMEFIEEIVNVPLQSLMLGENQMKQLRDPRFYQEVAITTAALGGLGGAVNVMAGGASAAIERSRSNKAIASSAEFIRNAMDQTQDDRLKSVLNDLLVHLDANDFYDQDGKFTGQTIIDDINNLASVGAIDQQLLSQAQKLVREKVARESQTEALKTIMEEQVGKIEYGTSGDVIFAIGENGERYFILDETDDTYVVNDVTTKESKMIPKSQIKMQAATSIDEAVTNFFVSNAFGNVETIQDVEQAKQDAIAQSQANARPLQRGDRAIYNNQAVLIEDIFVDADGQTMAIIMDENDNPHTVPLVDMSKADDITGQDRYMLPDGRRATVYAYDTDGTVILNVLDDANNVIGQVRYPIDQFGTFEKLSADKANIIEGNQQPAGQPGQQQGAQPVQQPKAEQQPIPRDEQGRVMWTSVPVERTLQEITSKFQGQDAVDYIDALASEAQKQVNKLAKEKPKSLDPDQRSQELEQIKAAQAQAQAELDYWNSVSQAYQQMQSAQPVQQQGAQPSQPVQQQASPVDAYRKRVAEWAAKGFKITILESKDQVTNAQALAAIEAAEAERAEGKAKFVPGWFEPETNMVYIYLPDVQSVKDVDYTIIHEVVAHKGLRALIGEERYETFCLSVWDSMSKAAQEYYINYPGVNGNKAKAADEYIAYIAEKTELTPEEQTIWDKIIERVRHFMEQVMNTILDKEVITNDDIATLVRMSYANIKHNNTPDVLYKNNSTGQAIFSIRTYREGGRAKLVEFVEQRQKDGALTAQQASQIITQADEIYGLCEKYTGVYQPFGAWSEAEVAVDDSGKPVFSVIKANGDYDMNLDFSLVCKKRRTLDAVFDEMIRRGIISEYELGQLDIALINNIIRQYGFETACRLCFVDSRRFQVAAVADKFCAMYNSLAAMNEYQLDKVIAQEEKKTVRKKAAMHLKYNPQDRVMLSRDNFMSANGFEGVSINRAEVMKLYNSAKGTGGPKASLGDVQYLNDIIGKNWTPEKAYAVGGVRLQSFSDYIPRMFFDYVQMVAELAAKQLPVHCYTKESIFVKQFGLTGIKINMSLVPRVDADGVAAGLDKDGNYAWQEGETFPYEEAIIIQNTPGYMENCGTIAVGVSDRHIRKMLSDENIRMIIPYHKSGLNKQVAIFNNIDKFTDYTKVQNTRYSNGNALSAEDKANHFDFNGDLLKNQDPRGAAQRYLDWCDENNYLPKFDQFRDHPNYYKLLEDFTTIITKDGVDTVVPQLPVQMVFPGQNAAFGSISTLIQQGLEEDAILEGRRNENLPAIVDDIQVALEEAKRQKEEAARAKRAAAAKKKAAKKKPTTGDVSFRVRTDAEKTALFDKAKEIFGTTNNFKVTGYMLPDGSLLDFSGKWEGGPGDRRYTDHRAIGSGLFDAAEIDDNYDTDMYDFIANGAIRLMPESAGIYVAQPLTEAQEDKLASFIYRNNGEVILEITNENGDSIAYIEYNRRTSAEKVLSDIDNYFSKGIVPVQPEVRFRTSTGKEVSFEQVDITGQKLRELEDGEFCHVERIFTESKYFDFTAGEKIESANDVAYIFSQLEDESVENAFAVLVKDGKPYVIHIGMGGFDYSMFNMAAVVAADKLINADQVYMVHNHPSGALRASDADLQAYKTFKNAFGAKLQDGVIINLKSGKFAVFNEKGSEVDYKNSPDSEVPVKVYAFNKQVFDVDYNPQDLAQISSPVDVASFVSSHRLGDRAKLSSLILNKQNRVVGNIFLPFSSLDLDKPEINHIAGVIADHVIKMGGTSSIIYGSGVDVSNGRAIKDISDKVEKLSGRTVSILDWIHVKGNAQKYKSALDEGAIFRTTGDVETDLNLLNLQDQSNKQPNGLRDNSTAQEPQEAGNGIATDASGRRYDESENLTLKGNNANASRIIFNAASGQLAGGVYSFFRNNGVDFTNAYDNVVGPGNDIWRVYADKKNKTAYAVLSHLKQAQKEARQNNGRPTDITLVRLDNACRGKGDIRSLISAMKGESGTASSVNTIDENSRLGKRGIESGVFYSIDILVDLYKRFNFKDPSIDALAARVFEVAKNLNVGVIFSNNNFTGNVVGFYAHNNSISIKADYINSVRSAKEAKRVLLHETIHAVTTYALYPHMKHILSPQVNAAADELRTIYDALSKKSSFKELYGGLNVREMVAELANPEFRKYLKSAGWFKRIVRAIAHMFNPNIEAGTTKLEEIEKAVHQLLDSFDSKSYRFFNSIDNVEEDPLAVAENNIRFRTVTDPQLLEKLNNEPTMKVYRAMQVIDGKLYPPMSAYIDGKLREPSEIGVWEMAEENPDLADDKGYFKLQKTSKRKDNVPARYNPYFHTSDNPLNDQFASAQDRPNLVTVEVEIPVSELTSGYKAEKAKDPVGEMLWNAGVVQKKLTGKRKVYLSRYAKPVRIVSDSEVADEIVKLFGDKKITMPSNVVTPSLRSELEKRGVPFIETNNNGKPIRSKDARFRYTAEMEQIKAAAEKDGTFMKAPNGLPTKLTEKQWLQVRTDAFKKWFGDWINEPENSSKVIDPETGEPRVVYHGSDWNPLKEKLGKAVFDEDKVGDNFEFVDIDHNFFFTASKMAAEGYGDAVTPVFLNIRNMDKHIIREEVDGDYTEELGHEAVIVAHDFGSSFDTAETVENPDGVMYTIRAVDTTVSGEDFQKRTDAWRAENQEKIDARLDAIAKELSDIDKVMLEEVYRPMYQKLDYDKYFKLSYDEAYAKAGHSLNSLLHNNFLMGVDPRVENEKKRYDEYLKRINELQKERLDISYGNIEGFPKYDPSLEKEYDYHNTDIYALDNPNNIKSATDNVGAFSTENNDIRFRSVPVFQSNAERGMLAIKQDKATPLQWIAMLKKNGGLKAGEDKWIGLTDWLNQQSGTVTKQQVLDYIRENQIIVVDQLYTENPGYMDATMSMYGDKYKKAFGYDYDDAELFIQNRELVYELYNKHFADKYGPLEEDFNFTLDDWDKIENMMAEVSEMIQGSLSVKMINKIRADYSNMSLYNHREIALVVPTIEGWNEEDDVHFGDAGEGRAVAWIRFGETVDQNGNAVLVIDEVQSKRHQDAREQGYASSAADLRAERTRGDQWDIYRGDTLIGVTPAWSVETPEAAVEYYVERNLIPDAPFEKNWHELAMKRMLRYAAENGFDKIAWTTGQQQAERYDLSKILDEIAYYKSGNKYIINAGNKDDSAMIYDQYFTAEELAQTFGKEIANKIINNEGVEESILGYDDDSLRYIHGENMEIGGAGMKAFYDKMLVDFMNKYGKKWDVKVEDVFLPELGVDGETIHSVEVTDAMKASVLNEPQVMFRTAISPADMLSKGLRGVLGQEGFDNLVNDITNTMPLLEKAADLKRGMTPQQIVSKMLDEYLHNGSVSKGQDILFAIQDALTAKDGVIMPEDDELLYQLWKELNPSTAVTIKEKLEDAAKAADIRFKISQKDKAPASNDVKLTRSQLWQERLVDRMISIKVLYDQFKKIGIRISDDTDPYITENLAMSRVQTEDAQFKKQIYTPLIEKVMEIEQMFIQMGIAKDEQEAYEKVGDYLYARHAPERNKNICCDEIVEQMMRSIGSSSMELFKNPNVRTSLMAFASRLYNERSNPNTPKTAVSFAKNLLKDRGADAQQQAALAAFKRRFIDTILVEAQQQMDKIFSSSAGTNRSGMSDQEAKDIMSRLYVPETRAALDELSTYVKKATHFTIDTWQKYSLINNETATNLKNMYNYYIPLRSWEEKEDVDYEQLATQAFNRASEIINLNRKARGRKSKADDPLAYIASLAQSAIVVGNKNMIRLNLYRLIKANQNNPELVQFATLPKVYYVETPGSDTAIAYDERPAQELFDQGLVKTKSNKSYKWHKSAAEYDAHIVPVILNGTRQMIELRGEIGIKAASAINNTNVVHWQAANALKPLTNWLSAVRTSYNPEFVLVNFLRDFGFATAVYPTEGGKDAQLIKNLGHAFASIHKLTRGQSVNSQWDAYYQEFLQEGGQTGFFMMRNIDTMKKEIEDLHKLLGGKGVNTQKVKEFGENIATYCNNMSESAMRLAVYITERENGASAKQAAYKAHEITVNFNRKGTWSGIFGGFYSFFNASIQGTARLFSWANAHKKQAAITLATMTLAKLSAGLLAAAIGGDDYDELSDYVKFSNIVIPIGEDDEGKMKFLCIPMPQGIRAVTNIADNIVEVLRGNKTVSQAMGAQMANTVGEFLPLSFDAIDLTGRNTAYSIATVFAPTAIQPWMDVWVNMDFKGDPIFKEPYIPAHEGKVPEYKNVYNNTNPLLVGTSRFLNKLAGGTDERSSSMKVNKKGEVKDNMLGYALDINPAKVEHILNAYLGGLMSFPSNVIKTGYAVFSEEADVEYYNTPVINRFVKQPFYEDGYAKYYQIRDMVEKMNFAESAAKKMGDYESVKLIKKRNAKLVETFEKYDKRVKQLQQSLKKDNLSTEQRQRLQKQLDELVESASEKLNTILKDEENRRD